MSSTSLPPRTPLDTFSPVWRRVLRGGLLLGLLAAAGAGAARAPADDDLEPVAPRIFFPTPDEETAKVIDGLVENSYADLNKVVVARDLHVRRFGLWSVPRLVQELTHQQNEPAALNAALTCIALRERCGSAPELLPLLKPLIQMGRRNEGWRRACAFLVLGAFHGEEGLGRPRVRPDALLLRDPVAEARTLWVEEVLPLLCEGMRDPNSQTRAAAALALGKSGGADARACLLDGRQGHKDASVEPQIAFLLGLGLLGGGGDFDQDRFVEALADVETRVRAAAALGATLQLVSDAPPAWTTDAERLARALASARVSSGKEDAAEAVFARGCLAALTRLSEEWDKVFAVAVQPRVEREPAAAASQVLLWCDDPTLRASAIQQLTGNSAALQDSVLAGFLLRAGRDGSLEGVRACRRWLGNPGLAPPAAKDWDVRWHATIGLLRALAEGRLNEPQARKEALEALGSAIRGLDHEAPLLAALTQWLPPAERERLESSPDYRLPEERLRAIEAEVTCRYGLLERDLRSSAVQRLNAMVYAEVFLLADLRPLAGGVKDKDGSAKRFLERCLASWPYYSRLDLLADRGRRPAPMLQFDQPGKAMDRPREGAK